MENLEGICSRIGLQEEVREKISEIEQKSELSWTEKEIPALTEEKNWKKAREELKKNLGEDPNGMKMLFCMLKAAVISWEKYQKKGIEPEIFDETMKCFSRFVENTESAMAPMALTGISGLEDSFPSSFSGLENWNMKKWRMKKRADIFLFIYLQMQI